MTNLKKQFLNHLYQDRSAKLRKRFITLKNNSPEERPNDAVLVSPFRLSSYTSCLSLHNLTFFLCLRVQPVEGNVGESLIQKTGVLIFGRCYRKNVEKVAKFQRSRILWGSRNDRKIAEQG